MRFYLKILLSIISLSSFNSTIAVAQAKPVKKRTTEAECKALCGRGNGCWQDNLPEWTGRAKQRNDANIGTCTYISAEEKKKEAKTCCALLDTAKKCYDDALGNYRRSGSSRNGTTEYNNYFLARTKCGNTMLKSAGDSCKQIYCGCSGAAKGSSWKIDKGAPIQNDINAQPFTHKGWDCVEGAWSP